MVSIIKTIALQGLEGVLVKIEVDISNGLPAWEIIGLPDASVKESKERVRTAIKNSGIQLLSRKYVINLSPANIRKAGSNFDLAVAVGLLYAMGAIKTTKFLENTIFIGELSLNGNIESVDGVLPMCIEALRFGIKRVILAKENSQEASYVKEIEVIGVTNLKEVIEYLDGKKIINVQKYQENLIKNLEQEKIDFEDVKGQASAKRAIEVAVARQS